MRRLPGLSVPCTYGDELRMVGEAENVDEAIDRIPATQPDVVLLDVHLPVARALAVVKSPAP